MLKQELKEIAAKVSGTDNHQHICYTSWREREGGERERVKGRVGGKGRVHRREGRGEWEGGR